MLAGVSEKKETASCDAVHFYSGGADQARTDDPLLAKQVLYQLSYNPKTLRLSFESPHILYAYITKVNIKNFSLFVSLDLWYNIHVGKGFADEVSKPLNKAS